VGVLAIRAVDVWFPGGPQVLHQVDLRVGAGEHWALLGPNGAGKSTLLGLAGAQRFPSCGTVDILGRRLGRVDVRELRCLIGAVDVRQRLPGELSLEGYVGTGATQTVQPVRAMDAETARRVAELLALLALTPLADRPIAVCSQGEQARARLARALVPRPSLLLLDEPAAGLDLPGRADLLGAVEAAARHDTGLASVTVAHHLEELPAVTSHVALLRDGRVMAQGDVSLLHDAAALSACFGRTVRSFDVGGRWFATALPA
jgi:iron complex transport system ATP-binding protein